MYFFLLIGDRKLLKTITRYNTENTKTWNDLK